MSKPFANEQCAALSVALLGLQGGVALAQDAEPAALPPVLEEIVVTAQKRVERLQDAPLAVTALSGQELTDMGIHDTSSLAALTPSLTYQQGNNVNSSNFRIRGVGTQVFGNGLEPDVSVVVDGVVLARAAQGFTELSDITRVEVLRGPQGTLFGKNAIAGVINVTTEAPAPEFQSYADATFAEEGEYRFHASLSGPINDELGFRLTGYYDDVGGNVEDLTTHTRINGYDSDGVRGKLVWLATDDLQFMLTGDYRNMHGVCCSSVYVQVQNPLLQRLLAPVTAGVNNRQSIDNASSQQTTGQSTFSLQGDLKLSDFTLTSITAYQGFDFNNNLPLDGLNTPTPLYLPATNGQFDINGSSIDIGQFTEELRLTSPGTERFNYVAGLYFLHFDLDQGNTRRSGVCAPGGAPGGGTAAGYGLPCLVSLYRSMGGAGFHADFQDRNVAAFGNGDLKLVEGLSALGGVRVQNERISYAGSLTGAPLVAGDLPLAGFTPNSGSGHSEQTAVTGKAGFKYEFAANSQAYLTWSKGYKGAGYNTAFSANFVAQQPVKPETAKTWELGYKTELFDDRLRLDTAVFYDAYKDLQVQANRGNPALGIVQFAPTNAGTATSKGVEFEFEARPVSSLTVSGGVTYLLASVDINGLDCILSAQAGAPVITTGMPINTCYSPAKGATPIQNVQDGVLPGASKWRGDLLARYSHNLPGTPLVGFVQASATSQSSFNYTIEQDPLTVQRAYTITDAGIGLRDQNDKYRVMLFADNVFNQHYLSSLARAVTLTTQGVTPNQTTGTVPKDADRYFGVTVSASF